jgi:hypothetical protein
MTAHDEGYYAILDAKYARIIETISQMHHISLDDAMEMFYTSDIQQLMSEGVADLHCRSDQYLAEEVWNEKNGLQQR